MNYRSIVRFASAAVLTLSAAQVFAGDFYEEKGVALSSYDALSYFTPSPDPILGVKDLSYDYKGSKFYFITPTHLRTFESNPEKYAPQYDGFDAYGVSQGRKVGAHPRVFAVVDGKLYLFSDLESRKNWKKDVAGNIARATEQWSQVSKLVAQNR
ncbi:MAG TPA: YHS domain-containing (seleno)protein [Steroidobacteraceae bacterium]|nr:YHS domain-containing (seleno)protein [Steroidobacteraceae bacterium]